VASAPEGRATIAEIAARFRISENHLTKVVHFLGKEGLLLNTRGRGGGLALAMPSNAINLGEVVRMTERGDTPAECFRAKGNHCALTGSCKLETVLAEAIDAFHGVLDRYTLADLVRQRGAIVRILFPAPPGKDEHARAGYSAPRRRASKTSGSV
jgi:Rrf2 family nitric oxide-sensitive transcriptional repressor